MNELGKKDVGLLDQILKEMDMAIAERNRWIREFEAKKKQLLYDELNADTDLLKKMARDIHDRYDELQRKTENEPLFPRKEVERIRDLIVEKWVKDAWAYGYSDTEDDREKLVNQSRFAKATINQIIKLLTEGKDE